MIQHVMIVLNMVGCIENTMRNISSIFIFHPRKLFLTAYASGGIGSNILCRHLQSPCGAISLQKTSYAGFCEQYVDDVVVHIYIHTTASI